MKEFINSFQVIFTAIGGFLGGVLGGIDGFLYTLILFILIDYITGLMVAIIERKLSSSLGFKGIFKKVVIFFLVCAANIIDSYLVGNSGVIRTAVIFFYISNEGISILENTAKIGLPIPEKLKNILHQLKEEDEING